MKKLPPKGLIVSCYLESMRGCEPEFIASVANLPQVVALRVEGLAHIMYARSLAGNKYIIGLVKQRQLNNKLLITPTVEDALQILTAGADMVATDCFWNWKPAGIGFPIMFDCGSDFCLPSWCESMLREQRGILATTHVIKAFRVLDRMRDHYPEAKINLEGGIETHEEVKQGFMLGADYVTIGKAINDPPTIVRRLVCG